MNKTMPVGILATLFFGLVGFAALANDSAAKISAGGIVLEKTDKVAMLSEDLYLSKDLVKVRYVYQNITSEPEELTIAFPLPRVKAEDVYETYPVHYDKVRFIDFETMIDGKAIDAREIINIRAQDGRNVTNLFKEKGWPLAPFDQLWSFDLDNQFDNTKMIAITDDLRQAGLLIDDPNGYQKRLWSTEIYYVWQHTFEPGRDVVVDHQYVPIAGGHFFIGDYTSDGWSYKSEFQKSYCASEGEWNALERIAAQSPTPLVSEVGYILKTGGNWAGPIKNFKLTLDKSNTKNIITLCWDGKLTKTAPTQFVFEAQNFVPSQDIVFAVTQAQ